MKIMYLNIFEGCEEESRFKKIADFINSQNPDILGMSELNKWNDDNFKKLKVFQELTNLPNVVFCESDSGFPIALFSKTKIINSSIIKEGFNTGLIKAEFVFNNKPLFVLLSHLNYRNEDARLKEIDIIKKGFNPEDNVIFVGDLNSLSPLDNYDAVSLLQELNKIGLKKFGVSNLRKDVISKILNLGFIDSIYEKSDTFEYTVPTTYNKDKAHFSKLRLDYIFVTKSINVENAFVVRTDETNYLSDHFPVIIDIN